ncbi:hypothetical protein D9758_011034 [Tetrapyrgos nigripes]|uniref:Uncharacterized protein n=1 Tax=Tetrapyrgos nigripes TaxID=182062 RepID=A0A8H5CU88_9AGAR|nr:hypothetical protein D9758_011034 [Tetrapyrgos nigripes]
MLRKKVNVKIKLQAKARSRALVQNECATLRMELEALRTEVGRLLDKRARLLSGMDHEHQQFDEWWKWKGALISSVCSDLCLELGVRCFYGNADHCSTTVGVVQSGVGTAMSLVHEAINDGNMDIIRNHFKVVSAVLDVLFMTMNHVSDSSKATIGIVSDAEECFMKHFTSITVSPVEEKNGLYLVPFAFPHALPIYFPQIPSVTSIYRPVINPASTTVSLDNVVEDPSPPVSDPASTSLLSLVPPVVEPPTDPPEVLN